MPRCYIPVPMIETETVARLQNKARSLEVGWVLALLAVLLQIACGENPNIRQGDPISSQSGASADGAVESETTARFGAALERAAADPGARAGFYLHAGCQGGSEHRSVQIFEPGVAIWGGELQFQLTEPEIAGLLQQLLAADYASLPVRYGGSPEPDRMQAGSARSVVCSLSVSVAGAEKEVLQINRGEQSESFAQLVNGLLDSCEEQAADGIGAESLEEGLEKVASGELDPVTLGIHFQRMNDGAGGQAASEFILDVEGVMASTRSRDSVDGYSDPIKLELTGGEVAELAWKLADYAPTRFAKNLWAPTYIDMTLRVLNQKTSLVARPYRGIDQETHGERQVDFDATVELLDALHERVLLEGSVDSTEDR